MTDSLVLNSYFKHYIISSFRDARPSDVNKIQFSNQMVYLIIVIWGVLLYPNNMSRTFLYQLNIICQNKISIIKSVS